MESNASVVSPKVSVITVVFNAAAVIGNTIKNIANQTYDNIELVVVDGGSTDETVSIIRSFERVVTKWISEPDKGIYDAMNKGTRLATGDWIIFMNAGDSFYENNSVEKFVNFVRSSANADMIFGDVIIVDGNREWKRELKNDFMFLIRNMICHQCIFYSKDSFKKAGGFDIRYRMTADFEHLMRMKTNGLRIVRFPQVISRYSLDGVSATEKGIRKIWSERMQIFSEHKGVPLFTRITYWLYAKLALQFRKLTK